MASTPWVWLLVIWPTMSVSKLTVNFQPTQLDTRGNLTSKNPFQEVAPEIFEETTSLAHKMPSCWPRCTQLFSTIWRYTLTWSLVGLLSVKILIYLTYWIQQQGGFLLGGVIGRKSVSRIEIQHPIAAVHISADWGLVKTIQPCEWLSEFSARKKFIGMPLKEFQAT